nr:hypothetical protein MmNV_48 [Menippe mercenaria nudivirus]
MCKLRIPNHFKQLIPFYVRNCAYQSIMWLPFNANPNLGGKWKKHQIDFLTSHEVAWWICEEGDCEERKKAWIDVINAKDIPSNTLFQVESDYNKFILIDYNFTIQDTNVKGLYGICMILCSVEADNKLKIKDIANIKLACCKTNHIYGNIFKFLKKYSNVPIVTYTNQDVQSRCFYNTYLYPWSKMFTKRQTMFNLFNIILLEFDAYNKDTCIDKTIHNKMSCAICNCLRLFTCIANNKFNTKSAVIRLGFTNSSVNDHSSKYKFLKCGSKMYITYAQKHDSGTTICRCLKDE